MTVREREALTYSFADRDKAIEFCREAKKRIKIADRFELMHSSQEVVMFPWHCVVEAPLVQGKETTVLDEEMVAWRPRPDVDEIGTADVENMKAQGNFLIAKEHWALKIVGFDNFSTIEESGI